jgi:hypothetical protein
VRRIAMLVASALVLAGCGVGGGDDESSSVANAPATTAAGTTAVDTAADKVKATTLLLRSADLPGWTAKPAQNDPADKALDDELAACVGRPSPSTYTTARAASSTFSMGSAEVSSDVDIVKTVEDFNADAAAVRGPKYAPCVRNGLTKLLRQQLPPGAAVQSATVARLPIGGFGVFAARFRATVKLLIQGQPAIVYHDAILLGKGRVELSASFTNLGRPFDPTLEQALVSNLGARLQAA